jgi:hypothetical protein
MKRVEAVSKVPRISRLQKKEIRSTRGANFACEESPSPKAGAISSRAAVGIQATIAWRTLSFQGTRLTHRNCTRDESTVESPFYKSKNQGDECQDHCASSCSPSSPPSLCLSLLLQQPLSLVDFQTMSRCGRRFEARRWPTRRHEMACIICLNADKADTLIPDMVLASVYKPANSIANHSLPLSLVFVVKRIFPS